MTDLISRQAAIDALEDIDCSDGVGISVLRCGAVDDAITAIKELPSAQPEPLTDKEQRIFLAAMGREEKVFKKCPFCGGSAEIKTVTRHVYDNLIVVKCTVCGASTKTFSEYKENLCMDAWNMRTEDCRCI